MRRWLSHEGDGPRIRRMVWATAPRPTLRFGLLGLILLVFAAPASADDPPAPDKGDFSLFDPTPDADLRSFSTDRPPKAMPLHGRRRPFPVRDLAVFSYAKVDGVESQDWTIVRGCKPRAQNLSRVKGRRPLRRRTRRRSGASRRRGRRSVEYDRLAGRGVPSMPTRAASVSVDHEPNVDDPVRALHLGARAKLA
jgi:hypothetical protein